MLARRLVSQTTNIFPAWRHLREAQSHQYLRTKPLLNAIRGVGGKNQRELPEIERGDRDIAAVK